MNERLDLVGEMLVLVGMGKDISSASSRESVWSIQLTGPKVMVV